MLAPGRYLYRIERGNDLVATEEDVFADPALSGVRRPAGGSDVFEASATLNHEGQVVGVTARYSRGPFSRSAAYEAGEEFMRGSVNAMGGRTVETAKLGRFREVDAGLILFRALIIAHLKARGQTRWTGRAVVIDPKTLVARSQKQTCRMKTERVFVYEARMGDSEEIEIDESGRIERITDNAGQRIVLEKYSPELS